MSGKKELKVYPGMFGKGISIIFFVAVMMFFSGCITTGLTNTVIPMITEANQWENTVALSFVSYAMWVGVVTTILFSQVAMKKGPKPVAVIGLFGGAVSMFVFAHAPSLAVFCICIITNRICTTAYQAAAAFMFISNWFPKKKGIALGWATMGVIFVDILFIPAVTKAISVGNGTMALNILALAFAVAAILTALFIKTTPEEAGAYQDNEPCSDQFLEKTLKMTAEYKSPWTFKKLLTTRVVWVASIGLGFLWMAALGISAQNVPRLLSFGYTREFAVMTLQVAGIFALVGSFLFGVIDKRIGTKKACIIYGVAQTIGMILLFPAETKVAFVWISLLIIYTCFGAIANLVPSMIVTLFGRWDYPAANRIMYPIVSLLFGCTFKISAAGMRHFGSWTAVCGIYLAITVVGLIFMIVMRDKMLGTVLEVKED